MNVTVYCASSFGEDPAFSHGAIELGSWIAKEGHTLVYGGSQVGLMGLIADTVLASGGRAIGVMPRVLLDREPPHGGLTELYSVETMAERKSKMIELGDVFVALPGGPGTLEELSEIISFYKIGIMPGLMFILNIDGYYDSLVELFDRMIGHGFMTMDVRAKVQVVESARELTEGLERLARS